MEFYTDIYGPERMNPTGFGDASSTTMRFTLVVLTEIPQQLLDGLP